MLTSIRGLSAATLSAGLLLSAAPAFASEGSSETAVADEAISADLIAASAALDSEAAKGSDVVLSTSAPSALERAAQPVSDDASELGEEGGFSFSANVAFTTEYRFRGVDLSGGEFAVQGGFDLSHESGFYVGTWGSNLDEDTVGFGSTELDLYGGWSGDLTDGLSADVGVIAYLYPDAPAGAGDTDYVEFYGSLSVGLGPVSATGGIAYAPEQDSLGGTDNLYLYTDLSLGIPDTPITLNAHLGYTDGFLTFTNDSKAVDWSLSADLAAGPVTFSAAYVGVEGDAAVDPGSVFTDDAFVLTVSASF
ncbi:MAG: TorF family putative porin [Pseudomonadota bacterium]